MKPPTKRYRYECKCGKNPLHGTIATGPVTERAMFEILDLAWAQSHNEPGCSIKSKVVELHAKPKAKRADKGTSP